MNAKRDPGVDVLVRDSTLDPETQAAISELITQADLWSSERAELAEELIAHFLDGRDAGLSERELLAAFGERRTAARLIHLAKGRQRPKVWRAARVCLTGLVAITLTRK